VLVGFVGLLAVLAACGGGSSGGGSAGNQPAGSTKVTMTDYKFTPADINVKSGKVTLFLVNSGAVSHDMVVTGADGKSVGRSDLIQPGDSNTFTIADLPAGSYKVICDQPGHLENGMKGTLTAT
jgi:uncharacterized cupredoxin-like copper-binding protein